MAQLIGDRLRDVRHARGWTQERLGELAGMARTTVTAIETNREGVGRKRLARLADALQVSVLELAPAAPPDERGRVLEERIDALEERVARLEEASTPSRGAADAVREARQAAEAADAALRRGASPSRRRRTGGDPRS